MKSIIQMLFDGNLCEGNKVVEFSYERKQRLAKLVELEEALLTSFTEEQKANFEKFVDLSDANWVEEVDGAYKRGFKIGGLFAIEMHQID